MYAVIETGGKQFRVAPGDAVRVDKMAGEVGAEIEIATVKAVVTDNGEVLAGKAAEAARVRATIMSHGRGDKIIVFKFKRKKQYKKTQGHRQDYTALKVDEILA